MYNLDFDSNMTSIHKIKNSLINYHRDIDMRYVNYNIYRIAVYAANAIENKDYNEYMKLRMEQDLYYLIREYISDIESIKGRLDIKEKLRKDMCEMLYSYCEYLEENKDKVIKHTIEYLKNK